MRSLLFIVGLLAAAGAFAQAAPEAPSAPAVPGAPAPRGGLWQVLTPEQREQLWRSLTPEQKSELWRGLQQRRERPGDGERPWQRHAPERGDAQPRMMMTPEERQQMREQIREAHRVRRERMEAGREHPPRRD